MSAPCRKDRESFLEEIDRLLNECDKRSQCTDLSVITYMIRRIRSCRSALNSIKMGQMLNINGADMLQLADVKDLIATFGLIEADWVTRKEEAENADTDDEGEFYQLLSDLKYSGKPGRPSCAVDNTLVDELMNIGFSTIEISKICGVSRTTLWRRRGPLKRQLFCSEAELTDEQLERM